MLRTNQQFDEIRIVGGIAERTGNTVGRSEVRGRHDVCRSMTELARKFRANGDGYFYLAASVWPEGQTTVDLTTVWKTISGS
ncbi:MAG TPA: hypothetical protein VLV78_04835 [Thermoanaerobaculia bacterium]|nr:hypothetical protein [Thermoanaerobaculia bacterium]